MDVIDPSGYVRGTSEIHDGMRIDWDVPIEMDDGLVLRADVFRPVTEDKNPVIMSYGPYAKWLAFQDGYPTAWEIMIKEHPDVAAGSSNKYQSWEVVDPEKWVPDGYVCVRVDSRGAGRSPGYLDPFSPRETLDFYRCIEWAARRPWSTGKIGLAGISYYAINQWQVAGLQPPHLAAICIWEGAGDWYRDKNHQRVSFPPSRPTGMTCNAPPCSMAWEKTACVAALMVILSVDQRRYPRPSWKSSAAPSGPRLRHMLCTTSITGNVRLIGAR